MNEPFDEGSNELRHAEYVLGVLEAPARAAVEEEARRDPQAARMIALWQQRLLPLSEDLASSTPPAYLWARLCDALGLPVESARAPVDADMPRRGGLWNSLALWRGLGLGAGLAAVVAIALLLARPAVPPATVTVTPPAPAPAPTPASYLVAAIAQDDGVTGWTVTADPVHHTLVLVPASRLALAAGKSHELWLIPSGAKPIPLGVIPGDRPFAVNLPTEQFAKLDAKALLAVSVEPAGGSPTGQPTGPVVAKGAVRGA